MRDLPPSGQRTRRPAVAGRFYPGRPTELAEMVDALLDAVPAPAGEALAPAYVVPHAGYRYSGPTAAHAYARLRAHAERVPRVVLIGPAHYVRVAGCVAPAAGRWITPLGELPIDTEGIARLAEGGHVAVDDAPHAPEHSLEVQLPFLQRALPAGVPILPIVTGPSPVQDVAAALAAAVQPGTVVICSTDLSHYLDQASAEQRDARTAQAVLDLAAERLGVGDACGLFALRGLLGWARARRLIPGLLHLCTSADTAGVPSRVVGYATFAFADRSQAG